MLPANGEKAPINSIDRALANDHSSRPTLSSAAIGRWKIPKLWRAPTPMVRMTAPQITAIQKLRCGGALPAREVKRDVGEEPGKGFHEDRDIGGVLHCKFQESGIATPPMARRRDRSPRRRAVSCAGPTRVCARTRPRTALVPQPRP